MVVLKLLLKIEERSKYCKCLHYSFDFSFLQNRWSSKIHIVTILNATCVSFLLNKIFSSYYTEWTKRVETRFGCFEMSLLSDSFVQLKYVGWFGHYRGRLFWTLVTRLEFTGVLRCPKNPQPCTYQFRLETSLFDVSSFWCSVDEYTFTNWVIFVLPITFGCSKILHKGFSFGGKGTRGKRR